MKQQRAEKKLAELRKQFPKSLAFALAELTYKLAVKGQNGKRSEMA